MKKQILKTSAFLLSLIISFAYAKDVPRDPFKSIEYIQLENGLKVFLAPSSETQLTAIRLEVGVGWAAENKTNWGVSHLLEHVLFRDKELREEMSYLQIIKEAGGSANGATAKRVTSYFGSIPQAKGTWLLENFSKMILEPKIDPEYVQKEKGTVELEIGTPAPVTLLLGVSPLEIFYPSYISRQNFWKDEFGLDFEQPFTRTQEQLSNRKLTAQQVHDHYVNYYYPSNMKLFIAGRFDREEMIAVIKRTWGVLKNRKGLSLEKMPKAKQKLSAYIRESVGAETSAAAIGVMGTNMTLQESEVLSSYTKYLSHKLMKELRNKRGQTYYASHKDYMYGDYGYTGVSFQSPNENLKENLEIVNSIIAHDTKGQMSANEIEEAKKLYLADYELKGREAEVMMEYAQIYENIFDIYGSFQSPFDTLVSANTNDYNKALKKYFIPENRYETVNRPPYFFAYDYMLFYAIVAVVTFSTLKSFLTKKFKNDGIRWVRKVKYPPLKALELTMLVVGWYLYVHLMFGLDSILDKLSFTNETLFTSVYLSGLIWVSSLIVTLQFTLSILPRKLMIVENTLFIKSVSYYSKTIPLNSIQSVQTRSVIGYPFPISKWMGSVGVRFHFYNLKFWKEGIVINLENGKSYFFSVDSAYDVKKELEQFLENKKDEHHSFSQVA